MCHQPPQLLHGFVVVGGARASENWATERYSPATAHTHYDSGSMIRPPRSVKSVEYAEQSTGRLVRLESWLREQRAATALSLTL